MSEGPRVRIAAAGDIHVDAHNSDAVAASFAALNGSVDLVLIAGARPPQGGPERAAGFVGGRREPALPVIAVLGTHAWPANRHDEVVDVLRAGDIDVLEGGAWK